MYNIFLQFSQRTGNLQRVFAKNSAKHGTLESERSEVSNGRILPRSAFWFYHKLSNRKAGASSIVSVALIVAVQGKRVRDARIALGAVTALPLRATRAEAILLDEPFPLREQIIEHCLSILATELREPLDDFRASADYRVAVSKALVGRRCDNSQKM